MVAIMNFATLAVVTIFAAGAAFAFDWMLLRAMFVLMQPTTARSAPAAASLAGGTARVAKACTAHR
jgi:hypothetical protein